MKQDKSTLQEPKRDTNLLSEEDKQRREREDRSRDSEKVSSTLIFMIAKIKKFLSFFF